MRLPLSSLAAVAALSVALVACDVGSAAVGPSTTTVGPSTTTAAPTTHTSTTTLVPRDEVRRTVTLESDGRQRSYELFIPAGPEEVALPLVLDLHGAFGTPQGQDLLSGMQAKAAEAEFIVAQPAGLGMTWDTITGATTDVDFLRAVVADISDMTSVDPDRVYVVGMSNGGGMADRMGCVAGDVFAAVATVAGWYVPAVECDGARAVPILAFHGTADRVVPFDGDGPLFVPVDQWAADWAARNGCATEPTVDRLAADVEAIAWLGCGGDVELLVVDGGGHGWPGTRDADRFGVTTSTINATDLIWDFFVAHPMG